MSIASYTFLPYLRQGIANSLRNTGGARGIYTVALKVEADGGARSVGTAPRDVELYGPGDIVGIDPRVLFKTEPLNWITNFESNYLAHVDFYDEDFPWRYTPLAPEAPHRLKPWLALVVLEEAEFTEGANLLNRPLPYFTLRGVAAPDVFPKADQLWAWAHVQVNQDIVGLPVEESAAGINGVLDKLQTALQTNPDVACSRLICPRRLKPNQTYHAFVVPAFESGRVAGLGGTAAAVSAARTALAWEGAAPPTEFPIYYRWQFMTGAVGDFEDLVRLLVPKPADLRVGRRDMDMARPGANLNWVEAPDLDLEGILRLGGALQVPRKTLPAEEREKLDTLDAWGSARLPHPFQKQIAALLNLADEYNYQLPQAANTAARVDGELPLDPDEDADPLITPPIYGRWHAAVERVLQDRHNNPIHHNYNWLTELNLDPRYRVPAHFGTRVVQQNQENYMNAAWEQIGDVLKANRQIRLGQIAQGASAVWHQKHLAAMTGVNPEKALLLTAPLQQRILVDGATVFHAIRQSRVPNAVLSAPMRRVTRPGGRLVKRLQRDAPTKDFLPEALIGKLEAEEIVVAPPKTIPPAVPSATGLGTVFVPPAIPDLVRQWLQSIPWLPYVPLLLAILILLLTLLLGGALLAAIGLAVAAGLGYLYRLLLRWKKNLQAADVLKPAHMTPDAVDDLPNSPDFRLTSPEDRVQPSLGGSTDSPDAIRFKEGLRDAFRLVQATRQAVPPAAALLPLGIAPTAKAILQKLDPKTTIPAWTWQHLRIPAWIREQMPVEQFTEVMAYPRFDLPMYKPLADISAELFLPNINLIEYNSITLLETNQKFIEAYMVGLNHEFARELLWREYPTDQRGSYFRQFWDVSALLKGNDARHTGKTEEQVREMYRDIPKLHLWSKFNKLGAHDHRQRPGAPGEEEVVLVIRGELLKKYPNAVVYAHKAVWENKSAADPSFDRTKARDLYLPAEGEKESPSFEVIRTPLYQAKVDPDISFFGFKLGVQEARGESDPATLTLSNAGWFFVIKERPGEPRFGFDIPKADVDSQPNITWNDVSWSEVLTGEGIVDVNLSRPAGLTHPIPAGTPKPDGLEDQHNEDLNVKWNTDGKRVDAADLAYILYQVPVLVAVHASEMLPETS